MFKLFDYKCDPCDLVEERLVLDEDKDEQVCHRCGTPVQALMPAPVGYVHNTRTKVRCRSNKFKSRTDGK